ncbi:hypothetical protein [Nitratifractor sp.]
MKRSKVKVGLVGLLGLPILLMGAGGSEIRSSDGSVTLRYNLTHYSQEVANGLGVSHDDGPYMFQSQVDEGGDLSKWGDAFEVDVVLPYAVGLRGTVWMPFFVIGHERVDQHTSRSKPLDVWSGNGNFIDMLPIDGSPAGNWYFGVAAPTDPVAVDYQVKQWRNYGNLGLQRALGEGKSLRFSLYYARQKTTLESEVYDPNDRAGTVLGLDEQIKGYSFGPAAEFRIDYPAMERLTLFARFSAALLYSHAKLDANQYAYDGTTWHVEDSRHDTAIHGTLELGLQYRFTPKLSFNLSAGAAYRNDAYRIVHPRAKEGEETDDPTSYHPGPAHLDRVGEQTFHFGASLTYRF